VKPILERLGLKATAWNKLVGGFGRLFINVAGKPQTINATRSASASTGITCGKKLASYWRRIKSVSCLQFDPFQVD